MVTLEQLPTCLVPPEHLFALLHGKYVMQLYIQMVNICTVDGFASNWSFSSVLVILMGPISLTCKV